MIIIIIFSTAHVGRQLRCRINLDPGYRRMTVQEIRKGCSLSMTSRSSPRVQSPAPLFHLSYRFERAYIRNDDMMTSSPRLCPRRCYNFQSNPQFHYNRAGWPYRMRTYRQCESCTAPISEAVGPLDIQYRIQTFIQMFIIAGLSRQDLKEY